MAWASTDLNFVTRHWARKRGAPGSTAYVYEVELYNPEVDSMVHRPWDEGPYASVMAPSGRVVRLVSEQPVRSQEQ